MQSQRVDSSAILTVGYDDAHHVLKVRFRNGRTYYYLAVPPAIHRRLLRSPSMGKYLNEVIKPAYRAVRVREGAGRRRG
jgi:hypothetical protein